MKKESATEIMGHTIRTIESPTARSVSGSSSRSVIDPGLSSSHIDLDEFRRFLDHAANFGTEESLSLRPWLQIAEAWRITQALRRCRGNRSAAARALGIGRRTLYAKMEKLGITANWGI